MKTTLLRNLGLGSGLLVAGMMALVACGSDNNEPAFTPSTGGSSGSAGSAGASNQCNATEQLCNGACTPVKFDINNCGMCGKKCAGGEVCSDGACALTCGGGTTKCGDKCVDTALDVANCGGCDKPCAAGESCTAGKCACPDNGTACEGKCVNLKEDAKNCGACGTACPADQGCVDGKCACKDPDVMCGGACVNVQKDMKNCGSCGTACKATEVCAAGSCTETACPGGLTKCGVDCVNTNTDSSNCGGCAAACTGGKSCVAGACIVCDSATTDCDGDGWLVSRGRLLRQAGHLRSGACEGSIRAQSKSSATPSTTTATPRPTCSTWKTRCPATRAWPPTRRPRWTTPRRSALCRTTEETPADKKNKTWGLIDVKILRADGTPLEDWKAISIRDKFGSIQPAPLEGGRMVVMSSGIASDATQTDPGPNSSPTDTNVDSQHSPTSSVDISYGSSPYSVKDWYAAPNPPLKPANGLPDSPSCSASDSSEANDSVMIVLRMRAPTNVRAFSFNSYFFSSEYPEYVCTSYNDQFIALVDTPSGTPAPIPNPIDKNLMTYSNNGKLWPIGINIAHDTSLFAVCESQAANSTCWDDDVSAQSCVLGPGQLAGTGFDLKTDDYYGDGCYVGGGTYWLTTAGNVIPGEIIELRIAIWDVGDSAFDSLAVIDGFKWLASATLPGTGN